MCGSAALLNPSRHARKPPSLRLNAEFAAGQSCVGDPVWKHRVTVYKLLANRGRARQRGVWCAHARNLSSLGVHSKLVKSAVEIMALCKRGSLSSSCNGSSFSDGREEEAGRWRRTPDTHMAKNKPHHTWTPRAWMAVKTNNSLFLFPMASPGKHYMSSPGRHLSFAPMGESASRCQSSVLSDWFCAALSCLKRTSK